MSIRSHSANTDWFTFHSESSNAQADALAVLAIKGEEAVSRPYEFEVELISKNSNIDFNAYVGENALLTLVDRSHEFRLIHGVIRQFEYLRTGNRFSHYRCTMVPRLWFLTQTQDHKIFQHKTVYEIIEDVLRKHIFTSESYSFKLMHKDKYPSREYCVQYGESDYHFLARLCQEEGIYFYFEHKESLHCLCFSDAPGGSRIHGSSTLLYHQGFGTVPDTSVISDFSIRQRVNSDSSTYKEWNFAKPVLSLDPKRRELERKNAPVPHAMGLEVYQYPHLYQSQKEGERYVGLQLQRQLTFHEWAEGKADIARLLPGHTFSVAGHPRSDANRPWWLVSVLHEGSQPGVLEHEASDEKGFSYACTFTVIPDDVRFVPEITHTKVRIDGVQSAIVTGPPGEEVYTDEFGRVKVQFHWDRFGGRDEKTTCWIRVATTHAGNNFGCMSLPRIGQEVLVEFMEGDPDRPLITGRGYNSHNMPPWELPGQKTLTGFQSREFKGAQRNQLLFDDSSGQVQASLSSDHDKSELNLGYITRIDHIFGRKEFRGEGFELHTGSWGSARAGKGMYISTFPRGVKTHQKDMAESIRNLTSASSQHQKHLGLAVKHEVQTFREHEKPLSNAMDKQNREIQGNGEPHGELAAPHLVIGSSAGIGVTAEESIHMHSVDHTILTAQQHISMASNKSLLVTAIERVLLFARSLGMKLVAGSGKMEIWAQTDGVDVIAEKVLQLISMRDKVHISSPKEILLTAGGSFISVNSGGVRIGTESTFEVKAAEHTMNGPATMPYLVPKMSQAEPEQMDKLWITDELGRPLDPEQYVVGGAASIASGAAIQLFSGDGKDMSEESQISNAGAKVNVITGDAIELSPGKEEGAGEQQRSLYERR